MRLFQAVLSASLPVDASGRAQLLPAGEFSARDGRPGPGKKWKLTDASGAAIAAALSVIAAATPVVIDYDHQTLYVQQNGAHAPAAGWIKSATWLSGQGLFAEVDWTPPAKRRIEDREYRFISPVITYDEAGNVTGVALAALCNFPAIVGMTAVQAALSTQFVPQETSDMSTLTLLIAALGLAAATTEADALSAVTALRTQNAEAKAKPAVPTALATALGLTTGADEATALSAVSALKQHAPDPGTVQLIASLQGQVTTLSAQLQGDKVVTAVDKAIVEHKLTAGSRAAYIELGTKDFAMLTAVLAVAPVIPGLGGQSKGDPDDKGGGAAALTTQQQSIARQLGLDEATYATSLKATQKLAA